MASRSGWFGVGVLGGECSPGAKAWWGGDQWDVEGEADEGQSHLEMLKQMCWNGCPCFGWLFGQTDIWWAGRQAVEAGRSVCRHGAWMRDKSSPVVVRELLLHLDESA